MFGTFFKKKIFFGAIAVYFTDKKDWLSSIAGRSGVEISY